MTAHCGPFTLYSAMCAECQDRVAEQELAKERRKALWSLPLSAEQLDADAWETRNDHELDAAADREEALWDLFEGAAGNR